MCFDQITSSERAGPAYRFDEAVPKLLQVHLARGALRRLRLECAAVDLRLKGRAAFVRLGRLLGATAVGAAAGERVVSPPPARNC